MTYTLNIAKINKLELSPNENNLYSLLYVIVAESVEYKPALGSSKSAKSGTLKKGKMINVFEEAESERQFTVKFGKHSDPKDQNQYILTASENQNIFALQCGYDAVSTEAYEED